MKKLSILFILVVLTAALFVLFHSLLRANKITQLRKSIQSGNATAVTELVSKNPQLIEADMDSERGEKLTPLSLAAALGQESVCDVLLRFGAHVNTQDKFGLTPLHKAVSIADTNIVFDLLQHGASASIRNAQGETALDFVHERIPSESVKHDILLAIANTTNRPPSRPK